MIVPRLPAAEVDLRDSHAALGQTTGDEAGIGEFPFTVELAGLGRLAADVEGFLSFGLHAEGHFERLDAGFELRVALPRGQVRLVYFSQQVKLPPLLGRRYVRVGG